MTIHKIFIGYTLRTVPDALLATMQPKFEGRQGTKEPDKIQAQIAEKEAKWREQGAQQAYTGTFGSIHLVNWSKQEAKTWKADDRLPFSDKKPPKPPLSLTLRNYLIKEFPDAWSGEIAGGRDTQVVFLGFDPKVFLKMAGIECSLPWVKSPMPAALWYGNSDHRDIEEAVLPSCFKELKGCWDTVIAARRHGLADADLEKYNKLFDGWTGPGQDAERDATIAVLLSQQLGFV